MSDLISRQAAIDALEWKWAGRAAIEAIKQLPSAQQEQHWIQIPEQLPKGDGLYLTTIKTDGEDKSPYLNGFAWCNRWSEAIMRSGCPDSGISAMKDYQKRVQEEKRRMSERPDMVNHPAHYQSESGLEVIDIIDDFVADPVSYYKGNIIKYILRYEKKGGVEDLEKARWYLNRLIAYESVNAPTIED